MEEGISGKNNLCWLEYPQGREFAGGDRIRLRQKGGEGEILKHTREKHLYMPSKARREYQGKIRGSDQKGEGQKDRLGPTSAFVLN